MLISIILLDIDARQLNVNEACFQDQLSFRKYIQCTTRWVCIKEWNDTIKVKECQSFLNVLR
jgi:hypothetical protein